MSNEIFLGTAWQDTKYDKLAKLRWLQVTELKHSILMMQIQERQYENLLTIQNKYDYYQIIYI